MARAEPARDEKMCMKSYFMAGTSSDAECRLFEQIVNYCTAAQPSIFILSCTPLCLQGVHWCGCFTVPIYPVFWTYGRRSRDKREQDVMIRRQ